MHASMRVADCVFYARMCTYVGVHVCVHVGTVFDGVGSLGRMQSVRAALSDVSAASL